MAGLLISLAALLELVPHLAVYAVALSIAAPTPDIGWLMTIAWLTLGGVVLRFVLLGSGYILSHQVAFRALKRIRAALIETLSRLPLTALTRRPSGSLKKIVIDDVAQVEGLLAHHLPELASGLLVPFAATIGLAIVDWRMALCGLAVLPIAFLSQWTFMRGADEAWRSWHAAEARANAGLMEFIRGVAVLKAFDRDVSSLERVRTGVDGVRDLAVDMTENSMPAFAIFFSLLGGNLVVLLPVGLWFYASGSLAMPELVLFLALGTAMLQPLTKLMFLFGIGQKGRTARERIEALLQEPELREASDAPALNAHPTVRFEGVRFAYSAESPPAVDGIDLTLAPGTTTAIVGPSGAGKSTLARLLRRACDPDAGRITLDAVPLSALPHAQRNPLISHVQQAAMLFDGSVAENLRLARPDASDADLIAAARVAGAHDFIAALPAGYATPLGDRGAQLSGGERQRLALARAILKGAPIIVLDEVTAAVDPISERAIEASVQHLAQAHTLFIIAHRLQTVISADQIVVMDGGRIIDRGTHAELVERCAIYAALWQSQQAARRWTLGAEVTA